MLTNAKNKILPYWRPLPSIVKQKLKGDYSSLYKNVQRGSIKDRIKDTLSKTSSWQLIFSFFIILTAVFVGINYCIKSDIDFKIDWLHLLNLSPETARSIIEQRIGNVATVIGLTLTVSTFLVNNLADKDKNHRILFKSVFIYPIVYYAISLMIWLLGISMLKDSLNDYVLTNAVVFAHYLIVILLILIAYLFSKIIFFLNSLNLHELYKSLLKFEVSKILLNEILVKEKKRIWESLSDDKRAIYEFQLARKSLKRMDSKDYKTFNEIMGWQTDNIKAAVDKKDKNALERVFETFNVVYEIYYNNIKDNELFNYPTYIINGREDQLFQGFVKTIEMKDEYLYQSFLNFISNHLYKAYHQNNHEIIRRMLRLLESSFGHIQPQYKSVYLKETIALLESHIDFKTPKDEFYLQSYYTSILKLVQATLNPYPTTSIGGFKVVVERFSRRNNEIFHQHYGYKNEILKLKYKDDLSEEERGNQIGNWEEKIRVCKICWYAPFAIKAWLGFLLSFDYINAELFGEAIQQINYRHRDVPTLLADYEKVVSSRAYLGLDEWDFIKRESNTVYSPCYPDKWAYFGLIIEVCLNDLNENFDYNVDMAFNLIFTEDDWPFNEIENRKSDWLKALGIEDEIYQKRKETFLRILGRLGRKQKLKQQQDIASQPYSIQKKVYEFKESNFETWKASTTFIPIFEHFGNVITKPITDQSLNGYPFMNNQFPKSAFVEQSNSVFFNTGSLGQGIGDYLEQEFLSTYINKSKKPLIAGSEFVESFEKAVQNIKEKGFNPTLVIVAVDVHYQHLNLLPNYRPKYSLKSEGEYPFDVVGAINNDILVVTYYHQDWTNEIIVCDFEKAFRLLMGEDDTFYNHQLLMNIRDFTEDEFTKIMTNEYNNYDEWSDDGKLDKEEVEAKIKNIAIVEIACYLKFEITNHDAFEVIRVE